MKRQILSFTLALLMSCALCACGSYRFETDRPTESPAVNSPASVDPDMMPDPEDGYVEDDTADDGMIEEDHTDESPIITHKP